MSKTAVWVAIVAAGTSFAQSALAQTVPEKAESSGDQPTAVDSGTASSPVTTDQADRVPAGSVVLRSRVVLPGDFGTWAYAPPIFGPTAVAVTMREWALSSRVSVIAEGAQDTLDHRFSGAAAGLRLHLSPEDAPFQLSLASGVVRDLSGFVGDLSVIEATGVWSQVNASHDVGRWRFAGMLRARSSIGDWNQPMFSGSGGVSFDLGPARVGVDYVFDDHGFASRSAIVGWVALPILDERFLLRLAAVAPTNGEAFSARLAFVVNF